VVAVDVPFSRHENKVTIDPAKLAEAQAQAENMAAVLRRVRD